LPHQNQIQQKMKKTVLITGSSSGIGKAAAQYFVEKGWNVAATMRKPEAEKDLRETPSLKLIRLDVQDEASIAEAVRQTIAAFGKIDVLVNNAGYGLAGVAEFISEADIRRQFDVNVFGVMAVTNAVLPHFRANKSGRIINVSSMGGRVTFPLFSYYHATKFAIEGYSESLNYELNPLGIDVKIIEPGGVKTDFGGRSMDMVKTDNPNYQRLQGKLMEALSDDSNIITEAIDVAKIIFQAATTTGSRMRYLVGSDARMMWTVKRLFGTNFQQKAVKSFYKI
jgi:NAD(P)-dependent dehydrogenase (short-subunit alcohol dehydrogenase family)